MVEESYICGDNLLKIKQENGILTAETILNYGREDDNGGDASET